MSSVDKGSNNVIPLSTDDIARLILSLIMSYLCPLMKHSAGNVICGQRYNIIGDNIQREMSSVDKGVTLVEITFSGQCHQWTKV